MDFGDDVDCSFEKQKLIDAIVSWVLITGILISFATQWRAICKVGASHSLSHWNLFIANLNNMFVLFNAYILTFHDRFVCCKSDWTALQCMEKSMGFFQFIANLIGHLPVFLLYFPFIKDQTVQQIRQAKALLVVLILAFIFLFISAAVIATHDVHTSFAKHLAETVGVIATVCTFFVWVPQIWVTYKHQAVGALSVPMLIMQAPGAALFAYFQAVPQKTSVTTWLPAAAVAVQEFVLLGLCIKYWLRDRRAKREKSSRAASAHEPINSSTDQQDQERLLPSVVAGGEADSLMASPQSFGSFANSPAAAQSPTTNGHGSHHV